ncbi:MAG: glycosyltransferase family 9 protein [Bdellovibrionales bacterium]|nr:glycosyltransferase family 9 protein [Bdellovibrionales bacterium]
MKILAVQLLRLGDVLMCVPALKRLKEQYPEAEIHLLMNDSCRKLEELLEGVDEYLYFERSSLQSAIGAAGQSVLLAHDMLAARVRDWGREDYDLLINFTQNRLSAHLCSLIEAKRKVGMHYSQGLALRFNNFWLSQLNRDESELADGRLHYTDLFQLATSTGRLGTGQLRARNVGTSKEACSRLVIQALSSDTKKDMSASFVQNLLLKLNRDGANFTEVMFIGAPDEEERLRKLIEGFDGQNITVRIEICSLAEAKAWIESSALMLSVDTSTKHIAAFTETPVVELALGGSDRYRTGVYQEGAVIISSQVDCFPCSHSQDCPLEQRLCETELDAQAVFEVIEQRVQGHELKQSEAIDSSGIRVEVVGYDGFGFWYLNPVNKARSEELFRLQIARANCHIEAQAGNSRFGPQIGHLSFLMKEFCEGQLEDSQKRQFRDYLGSMIQQQRRRQEELGRDLLAIDNHSQSPLANVGPVVHITSQRRQSFAVRGQLEKLNMELKLVENLDQHLMEIS